MRWLRILRLRAISISTISITMLQKIRSGKKGEKSNSRKWFKKEEWINEKNTKDNCHCSLIWLW